MVELADRAAAIAHRARSRDADDLARIRAANPEFAALADGLRQHMGGRVTYLVEFATGRRWGMCCEDRVRREGGLGVAVWPSLPRRKVRRA